MGCGALSGANEVLKPQLQFRKLKQIHQNSQTQIWTCQNKSRQKFSVKVFKKIFIHQENQSMLRNFQLQINRLYELANGTQSQKGKFSEARKHLAPYIRAWKDENCNLSLIMQYIQRNSLGDEVKGKLPGLFNQIIVAKLTQQILKTIQFLRSHGSIFCNFKTTNAFYNKNTQNVLITDYYNLQQYFKLSENNIFKNPIYSAPENVLFNQYFQETDIWRVGCFIIELLTCIKPWYKETMNNDKIIQNLKNHIKPPIPEKISNSCKNFLEKCFQTDHNRRTSLQELLTHEFITQNINKTARISKAGQRVSYERQNTSIDEIASYNLQVQLIDQSPRPMNKKISSQTRQPDTQRAYTSQLSPMQTTTKMMRKKSNIQGKQYHTAKIIISQNDQNIEKSTVELKYSRNFRTKRIKTQAADSRPVDLSHSSPYSKQKTQKQLLQLLNKKKAINIANPYDSPTSNNNYTASRKVSKTANYRLSKSKKKIATNQITLNNQVLSFNQNSSSKYWPSPETPAPFNYLETAEKLNLVMKEIEKQGGDKYYKKPLKLLKQRLRDKTTLRTQTSITLQDSRALLQKSQQQIQEIDLDQSTNNLNSDEYLNHNQTELSKISTSHQNQVIQTMTSKALKQRFQTEQKHLRKQRIEEKVKWEQQLKQGREFIKNEFNKRYFMPRNGGKIMQHLEE